MAAGSATDVVVTFSEPIASVPIGGISLSGAGTLDTARFSFPYLGDSTKVRVGVTSTSVTAITFTGIVDVNEGATASPSASITTGPPAQPWDGWTQVQLRIGPNWSQTAEQQQDNFQGAVVWGTPNAEATSWGINWETAVPGYTEVLLSTKNEIDLSTWKGAGAVGHKWIQIDKISASLANSGGFEYVGTIKKSWNSATPFTTNWFLRANLEDPFIFATKDGQTSTTQFGHLQDCYWSDHLGAANNALLLQGGGIRVYVR